MHLSMPKGTGAWALAGVPTPGIDATGEKVVINKPDGRKRMFNAETALQSWHQRIAPRCPGQATKVHNS